MNNNFIALSSLAMDLKRAAIMYHRGSGNVADRFLEEALKRKSEIDQSKLKPYLKKCLLYLDHLPENKKKCNDDLLMYSVLFQNASLKIKSELEKS